MSDIIAFDPTRRTNAKATLDARTLGWFPGTILDATFGHHGGFWKEWWPSELTTNDLHAEADHNVDITSRPDVAENLPTVNTVLIDLDYRLNGKPDRGERDKRYGTDLDKDANERMLDMMRAVLNLGPNAEDFLLVKCQDQISSGYLHRQMGAISSEARKVGFRLADELWVFHEPPSQKSQVHARRNASALLCFKRGGPKRWSHEEA